MCRIDVEDIIKSGILDQANISQLKQLYEEYLGYTALQNHRYNDLKTVLEKWQKYKGRREGEKNE